MYHAAFIGYQAVDHAHIDALNSESFLFFDLSLWLCSRIFEAVHSFSTLVLDSSVSMSPGSQ